MIIKKENLEIEKFTITKEKIFDYFYITFGLCWLILVMAFARGYTQIKTYGLILILIVSFLEILFLNKKINIKYVIIIIGFVSMCTLSLLFGIINGYKFNSDDNVLINYYIMIPIGSLILATIFDSKKRLYILKNVLIFINFYINSFNILYFLAEKNIIPKFSFLNMGYLSSANIESGELALRMSNEPALIFLMPFVIISLYNLTKYKKIFRIQAYTGVLLGIVYAALSGRRALQVVIIGSFIYLSFLVLRSLERRKVIRFFSVFVIFLVGIYLGLTFMSEVLGLSSIFETIKETFTGGFSQESYGMIKRNTNTIALLEGWAKSPFTVVFGNGLNSYAQNSIANSRTLWSYEVFYPAFLHQVGVIGMVVFLLINIAIINRLAHKYRVNENSNEYRAINVGFICMLIATATNPLIFNIWLWAIVAAFII